VNPPRARAGGLLASAPRAGPGEPTPHPGWAAVCSWPFCLVSPRGMGCRKESVLFVVFSHLMMAIHRLLDCSHGNGSCFQHPQPLHAVLALPAKRVRAARGTTRCGESCAAPAPAELGLLLPPGKRVCWPATVAQSAERAGGRQHGHMPNPHLGSPPALAAWGGCPRATSHRRSQLGPAPLRAPARAPTPAMGAALCLPAEVLGRVMNPELGKPAKQGGDASSDSFWSIPWSTRELSYVAGPETV